jgi:hypothetical protein
LLLLLSGCAAGVAGITGEAAVMVAPVARPVQPPLAASVNEKQQQHADQQQDHQKTVGTKWDPEAASLTRSGL